MRAGTGLCHINMGIGLITDQRVAFGQHARANIGMQVKARHQGGVSPDGLSQAGQKLALAIFQVLGDHSTVQVEIDCIHGPRRLQRCQEHGGDALEGVFLDLSGGHSGAPEQRRQAVSGGIGSFEEPGYRQVHPSNGLRQRLTLRQGGPAIGRFEIGEARFVRSESVGFVQKSANRDAHGTALFDHGLEHPALAQCLVRVKSIEHQEASQRITVAGHARRDLRRGLSASHPVQHQAVWSDGVGF